jgi:hypothetical protein
LEKSESIWVVVVDFSPFCFCFDLYSHSRIMKRVSFSLFHCVFLFILFSIFQFTPAFAKRIVNWLQDSKKLQHSVYPIQAIFAREISQPNMHMKIHGIDRKALHKHIDLQCLPFTYYLLFLCSRLNRIDWLWHLTVADWNYRCQLHPGCCQMIGREKLAYFT